MPETEQPVAGAEQEWRLYIFFRACYNQSR